MIPDVPKLVRELPPIDTARRLRDTYGQFRLIAWTCPACGVPQVSSENLGPPIEMATCTGCNAARPR